MNEGFGKTMINVFVAAGVFYVAVVVLMYAMQRNLMYFPDSRKPFPAASGMPDMREVSITTEDGLILLAWAAPPGTQGMPTVVLFHGNAGNIGHRGFKARLFLDAGFGLVLAEYRGYGGNPGEPSEEGFYADGRAVMAALPSLGVPSNQVVLYGESLGTGVAVKMAAEAAQAGTPVAALVLEAPFTSTADTGAVHYPFLPVHLLMKDRYASIERIADVSAPVFVVHGEQDRTVPQKLGRQLFEAAQEPKEALWLATAGHNDVFEHGAGPAVIDFLRRYVSGAAK